MSDSRPVAVVTGSATGVGRASAVQFAQRGYDVVINYSRSQSEAEQTRDQVAAHGFDVALIRCDVSVESQVDHMFAEVARRFGRLDVLVNNAATTHFVPLDDLSQMSGDKWDQILAVNLKGPFFCIRAAVPLMMQAEGGSIVNVSSVAGLTGRGSCVAYAASKGGLNTMTKSMALALAPKIRVNAVLPGPIDTRWIREGNPDWNLEQMTANYPLPRPSQPDDIAAAVIFLATGTAMTTGQLLVVDGGQIL